MSQSSSYAASRCNNRWFQFIPAIIITIIIPWTVITVTGQIIIISVYVILIIHCTNRHAPVSCGRGRNFMFSIISHCHGDHYSSSIRLVNELGLRVRSITSTRGAKRHRHYVYTVVFFTIIFPISIHILNTCLYGLIYVRS